MFWATAVPPLPAFTATAVWLMMDTLVWMLTTFAPRLSSLLWFWCFPPWAMAGAALPIVRAQALIAATTLVLVFISFPPRSRPLTGLVRLVGRR